MNDGPVSASRSVSLRELLRFCEACAMLACSSLLIAIAPFRLTMATTGRECTGDFPPSDRERLLSDLPLAVRRASSRVPWRTVCFQEGLALHWMLRRRGIASVLHYGLRQDPAGLTAHVWVTVDRRIILGEAAAGSHAQVAEFPRSVRS